MLDVEGGTERVELMLARRTTLSQAEEAVCELFSIIRENRPDPQRASAIEVT